MKIYTKTGDQGQTSLIGGVRVPKSHLRIETYGSVDELNSFIGLLRDQEVCTSRQDELKEIQDRLFTIGAYLASDPEKAKMKIPDLLEPDVTFLENKIDEMNEILPEMRNFILPGGHPSISFGHITRTVCRRVERLCVALKEESEVLPLVIIYLNRLSDYLFILCRWMHVTLNIDELPWKARI
ncbi:MAG: cob(I)yrinic acid a,c-diamide adenosyltransferase [Microscillaceae bacterium]|nr:cob(I)yrinic acid a,c-diamide adenosyltransferase [Microscillaceae bacterium]